MCENQACLYILWNLKIVCTLKFYTFEKIRELKFWIIFNLLWLSRAPLPYPTLKTFKIILNFGEKLRNKHPSPHWNIAPAPYIGFRASKNFRSFGGSGVDQIFFDAIYPTMQQKILPLGKFFSKIFSKCPPLRRSSIERIHIHSIGELSPNQPHGRFALNR